MREHLIQKHIIQKHIIQKHIPPRHQRHPDTPHHPDNILYRNTSCSNAYHSETHAIQKHMPYRNADHPATGNPETQHPEYRIRAQYAYTCTDLLQIKFRSYSLVLRPSWCKAMTDGPQGGIAFAAEVADKEETWSVVAVVGGEGVGGGSAVVAAPEAEAPEAEAPAAAGTEDDDGVGVAKKAANPKKAAVPKKAANSKKKAKTDADAVMRKPAAATGTTKNAKKGILKKPSGEKQSSIVKKPSGESCGEDMAADQAESQASLTPPATTCTALVAVAQPKAVPVYRDSMKARRFNNMLLNQTLPDEAMALVDEAEALRKAGRRRKGFPSFAASIKLGTASKITFLFSEDRHAVIIEFAMQ